MNYRIYMTVGPPGTGKTTTLAEKAAEAVEHWGRRSVLVCSLTKAAAVKVRQLKTLIPVSRIGTLHSHCYKALGSPSIAETKIAEWNDRHRTHALSQQTSVRKVEDGQQELPATTTVGDRCYGEYGVERARMRDRRLWRREVLRFAEDWEEWKTEGEYLDFQDLIDRARLDCERAPGNPWFIYLDECIAGDTNVTLSDGAQRDIRSIVEDKLRLNVLSLNHETQKMESRPIIGWHKMLRSGRPIRRLGKLKATCDHPVLTSNGKYVTIDSLHMLSRIMEVDCEKVRSNRQLHETGAVDCYRVAAWRRVADEVPQWREQRLLDSAIGASGGVSRLEIPGTKTVVQHASHRTGRNGIRRTRDSSSKESEDEFVYCIDVEHNHNFVAGGIVVHNCQDSSAAELDLLVHWARYANLVMVGDVDQLLYSWRGSDPHVIRSLGIPESNRRILEQSYRVPRAVRDCSIRWIEQIRDREPVTYLPRDEDGEVRRIPVSFSMAGQLLRDAEQYIKDGKSVMFLASCAYMLAPLVRELRRSATPFHNPYRRKNGSWNPLGRRGVNAADRIEAFLSAKKQGRWTAHSLKRWTDVVRSEGVLQQGAKKVIEILCEEGEGKNLLIDDLTICEMFGDEEIAFSALRAAWAGDLSWLRERILGSRMGAMRFPLDLADKHGPGVLRETPQIIVGSVHSVKGGECSCVYVCPDVSPAAMRGWVARGEDRDAVVRMFYVAMTRPRESLMLCQRSGVYGVDWI